jgi:hypothetical protein
VIKEKLPPFEHDTDTENAAEMALSSGVREYFDSLYSGEQHADRTSAMWGRNEESIPYVDSNPNIFMRELFGFVAEKAADTSPDSKERLTAFLQEMYETYFSYSPNIINRCSLGSLLQMGAKANRVPEIQEWFGQTTVGKITYILAFIDEERLAKMESSLEGLPLPDKLDVINFLPTVAADAVANGSWSRPALKRIEALIQKMQGESESPFLEYALDLSLDRIQDEKKEPSLRVFTFHGNSEHVRLSERLGQEEAQESDRIAHRIRPSIPMEQGDKYLRISQDAIAIIDRTNYPKYYGRITEGQMGAESKVDMRAVERIRQVAGDSRNLSKGNLPRVLDYVNINITGQALGIDLEAPEEVAKVWGEKVGVLSQKEWAELFTDKQKVDGVLNELELFERESQKEAKDKNEEASNNLVRKVYETVAVLVSQGVESPRGWEELKELVEKDDFGDETFDAAEAVLSPFQYADLLGGKMPGGIYEKPEIRALAEEWEGLRDLHQRNFEEGQIRIKERYAQAEAEWLEVIERNDELLEGLAARAPQLQDGLLRFMDELEDELASNLPKVEFSPYSQLIADKKVNPFPGDETGDLPLLMQQLHRPRMREKVEGDLGISFDDFNLNSQVHLLQFLAGNNKEIFTRMQTVLQKEPSYKREFLVSFLSCAGDYAFGERLVSITERFSPEVADKIFAKYSELVAASEKVRDYLRTHFSSELEANPTLEEKVVQGLLKKGKETLEVSALESASDQTVLARLEDVDAELQLFANTFKTLLKEGVAAGLEQFPGVELQEVIGGQIDPDTRDQMLLISDNNWRSRPHMYEVIMEGFKKNLEDPNTTFHIIRNGKKVVAFFRMDKKGPEEQYFGSVNVRPEAQGYALAPALLQQMFVKEAEGTRVTAHCYPWDKVSVQYIGDTGFVATKLIEYGQPSFEIVRDDRPEAKAVYQYAGKSYKELLQDSLSHPDLVRSYVFTSDPVQEPGDPENERFIHDMQSLLDGERVVSNFRTQNRKEGGVHVLVVVEPKPSEK